MPSKNYLKIYIDGYLLNKEPQGTRTYIYELYKEVVSQNNQHKFYFGILKMEDSLSELRQLPNVEFIILNGSNRLQRMMVEIPRLIKKRNFDFAHFQYILPLFLNKRTKYLLTIHDILFTEFQNYFSFWYRIKRNFLFKYSARKADHLLTVSEYSRQRISKNFKIDLKKIFISPNGVSKAYFEKHNKTEAKLHIATTYNVENYILYVSRVEPRKNQEGLLKAFLNLNLVEKGFHLVFIGKNSIRNLAFENILTNLSPIAKCQIHYFEHIDQEELSRFYQGARLFVFPSLAEGFGIPPLEAAAMKIPVICSNLTAMSEFDFFKPFHLNPKETNTLEQAISMALIEKNEDGLVKIANFIEDNYSWSNSASVISHIINHNS